jgi:hypothetical protein
LVAGIGTVPVGLLGAAACGDDVCADTGAMIRHTRLAATAMNDGFTRVLLIGRRIDRKLSMNVA